MSDIEEIANRTAAGIALAYRSGEADPVAVTQCLLQRISAPAADNIFISVSRERALREAQASARRYRSGTQLSPLDGVPIGWKDLIDVAGSPTTAGSALFRNQPPKTRDLAIVANAAAAGMVSMGKLNMSEFAYSGLGLNPHFGTPRNPNDRTTMRSPGGSSSGCGVAVAARLLPIAIGSDTGGSVRIPAAFNGVVGFKTSHGRIDATGVVPLSRTLDTIGPLARSVEDCLLADMVLRGAVTTPVRRGEPSAMSVVAPANVVLDIAEPHVAANFERSLEAFARHGIEVRRERVPVLEEALEMTARFGTVTAAEAYHEYHDIIDSDRVNAVDRRVVSRIMDGKNMSANDIISIYRMRLELIRKLSAQLGNAYLVMPTTAITAPEVAPLEADDALFHKVNLSALRNTMLGNILGLCGMALPNGHDDRRLPTSILVSAPSGEDERLLGDALAMERIVLEASQS
jgi:aspartyl-tRNA(Asn)/glutamyl-tRNA(Gln) amidotransferase subunit A